MPAVKSIQRAFPRILKRAACAGFIAAAAGSMHAQEFSEAAQLTQFAQVAAQLETLPESNLKALYLRCEGAAAESGLAFGAAAMCSHAYERLLKTAFNGDFDKLLAWWSDARTQSGSAEQNATSAEQEAASAEQEAASAEQDGAAAPRIEATSYLEEAFWKCDYSIARETMGRRQAAICGTVIEGVRKEKFRGDNDKLLQWWAAHHDAQHRKLSAQDAAAEEYPLP